MLLARALSASQKLDQSEKLYAGLTDREKTFLPPYMELYRLYVVQNNPDKGEAILKKAIANNPDKYDLLIDLAGFYYATKRRDERRKTCAARAHARKL